MATATESIATNPDARIEHERAHLSAKPEPEREHSVDRPPTPTDAKRAELKESLTKFFRSRDTNWEDAFIVSFIDQVVLAYPDKSDIAKIVFDEIFTFDEDLPDAIELCQQESPYPKMEKLQYFIYKMKQAKDAQDPLDAKMYQRLLDIRRILLTCDFSCTRLELAAKAFFVISLDPLAPEENKKTNILCEHICTAIKDLYKDELPAKILEDHVFRDCAASQSISQLDSLAFPRAEEMSRFAMAWVKFCVSLRKRLDEYCFAVVVDLTPHADEPRLARNGEPKRVELRGEDGRDQSIDSMKQVFQDLFPNDDERNAVKWSNFVCPEEKESDSQYFEVFDLLSPTQPLTRKSVQDAVANTFKKFPKDTVAFSVASREGIQTVSMNAIGYKFPIFSTEIFTAIFEPSVGGGSDFEEVLFPNPEFARLMEQINFGNQQ